jgi:hypothetical protein
MTRMDYLRDQAARAERLAYAVTDVLTVQRLASFAADCRREMSSIAEEDQSIACDERQECRNHGMKKNHPGGAIMTASARLR